MVKNNLAIALHRRYLRFSLEEDLIRAQVLLESALKMLPPEEVEKRGMVTNNLGNVCCSHPGAIPRDLLDRLIENFRKVMRDLPPDRPIRPTLLTSQGDAFFRRFRENGTPNDLEDAITSYREALT